MRKEVLKIENPRNQKRSNQDVYDAVNQNRIQPPPTPVNPLDELDQFEMPSQDDAPSPNMQPSLEVPEPPSYNVPSYSAPSFQPSFQQQSQVSSDYVQKIVESVVEEKWDDIISKVGDIRLWKDKMEGDITSIKQEVLRTQNHFENLQKGVLGKVSEYNDNITNINTEMKSLEKVFEKILQPMTENIKELSRITEKLKIKT